MFTSITDFPSTAKQYRAEQIQAAELHHLAKEARTPRNHTGSAKNWFTTVVTSFRVRRPVV